MAREEMTLTLSPGEVLASLVTRARPPRHLVAYVYGVFVPARHLLQFLRRPRGTARQRAHTMRRRIQRWRRENVR